LTDVVMPRCGGRQLADQLLPRRPAMKVLYMSGYTDDVMADHPVGESVRAFLQKPFTPLALAGKVREILDG
jgi:FixJ family two-component response regulator